MTVERPVGLDYIFYPGTVAVIGASKLDGFTQALVSTKMREKVYLVNPKYKEVLGKKCYASIQDIEVGIDYAVIAVKALLVPELLRECIKKGVKTAHIYTAGFSETGLEERIQLENMVKEVAKGRITLIGPNCMGVYCPGSGLSFVPGLSTEAGPVGGIFQSGTFAELFASIGKARNIKFSKAVSYGNGIDLDCPDFLQYLADDPETEAIALYIEGTRNGGRLKSALAKAAGQKPVVALKGGVTIPGSRVASSHTGSLAGSPEIWSSLFKQTGVIQVQSFDELIDTILALTHSSLPSGKGVSIITNSGGFSVIETDSCIMAGLEVPQFGEETMRELKKMVPVAGTSLGNPLDAWPIYYNTPGMSGSISDALKIVALDGRIHSMVLHFDELTYMKNVWGEALEVNFREYLSGIVTGCKYVRDEVGKPVIICVTLDAYSEDEEDRRYHLKAKRAFESEQFPVYSSLEGAIKALSYLYKYRRQFQ